jgi:ubiquinone/menaquinone biosynthesis C-methylase UbiE
MHTPSRKPQDTHGSSPAAEFDQFAVGYNAGMDNPVKRMVGDNPDIFIEVKARWLLANLAQHAARAQLAAVPQRLLDFGCGAGLFLQVLRRLGFAGVLHGCDVSSGMLAEAVRTWSEGPLLVLAPFVNGSKLPYADATFDVVLASAVFHHIAPGEREASYTEMARVLKSGGRCYVFEHNPYNPVTRWVVARTPIDRYAILLPSREARLGLAAAGMRHIQVEHLMFFPPKWRWAQPLEQALRWLPFGGQYVAFGEKP